MKEWRWIVRYGVAIILVFLLGAILGDIGLFKATALGETKLNASRVVRFLGYGGALVMFLMLARRAALEFSKGTKGLSFLHHLLMPLATLIVVSAGYHVLLLLVGPFLEKSGKTTYDWIFVIGIVSAALWLVLAWFLKAAPLMELYEPHRLTEKTDGS